MICLVARNFWPWARQHRAKLRALGEATT